MATQAPKDRNDNLHDASFGGSIQRVQSLIRDQINIRSPKGHLTRQNKCQRETTGYKVGKYTQIESLQNQQRKANISELDPTQRKAIALIQYHGWLYLKRKEGERKSKIENDFQNITMSHSTRMEHSILQLQVYSL